MNHLIFLSHPPKYRFQYFYHTHTNIAFMNHSIFLSHLNTFPLPVGNSGTSGKGSVPRRSDPGQVELAVHEREPQDLVLPPQGSPLQGADDETGPPSEDQGPELPGNFVSHPQV